MKVKCIMLVFGNSINEDFSNVKTINTKVVPNIGDEIVIKSGRFKVNARVINYKNVEDYELGSNERGGEIVYVFI